MLKYIGKGSLPGIPARDLTDEEVKRYGRPEVFEYLGVPAALFDKRYSSAEDALVSTGLYRKMMKSPAKEDKSLAGPIEDKDGE